MCETRINHEIHFAWQAQYLVKVTLVAGAAFREILIESWSVKCCILSIQNASPRWDEEGLRGGGCEMTMYRRIILGLSSDGRRIVQNSTGVARCSTE